MIDREVDILNFFNFDKKCPDTIMNCEELRKEFDVRNERLKKFNVCYDCSLNSLKSFFVSKIKFIGITN
jgi:hypothetical protein